MREIILRLLRAELRRSRTVSATLLVLIAISAALSGTGMALVLRTMSATEVFWEQAVPPDLVQMHSGELTAEDAERIDQWARQNPDVTDLMIMETLPVAGSQLWINGASQVSSVLEPALVTAPERFDLLLTPDGRRADPAPGEIWLPVHYQATGAAQVGDAVRLTAGSQTLELRVAGFVRDAQMNPSIVTSKRLVVSQADYEAVAPYLTPEYLVEMRAAPGASTAALEDSYAAANLPSQGVSVSSTVFRLANGLSTYLLAAAVLLVAGLLMVVVLLALRFALLSSFEEDLGEIGTLKAIGAPSRALRGLHLVKYAALAVAGTCAGLAAGYPLAGVLERPIRLYLGRPTGVLPVVLAPALGALIAAALVVASSWLLLARIDRLGVCQALRAAATGSSAPTPRRRRLRAFLARRRPGAAGRAAAPGAVSSAKSPRQADQATTGSNSASGPAAPTEGDPDGPTRERRRRLVPTLLRSPAPVPDHLGLTGALQRANILLVGVIALCVLVMVIPASVLSTVDSPRFATYMGIGEADVRDGVTTTEQVESALGSRPEVTRHAVLVWDRYELSVPGGQWQTVAVESGDHSVFPVAYQSGTAPAGPEEIALSHNEASELGVAVGAHILIRVEGQERTLTVTGIYQDISNGGRTAKARLGASQTPLWQVVYLDLTDEADAQSVADALAAELPGAKVTLVSQYAAQTMGATIGQLRTVTLVAAVAGCMLALVITAMSATLLIARERGLIATLRAIGASRSTLRRMYLVRFGALAVAGTVLGVVLAQVLGQSGFSLALAQLGAPGVELVPDPLVCWLVLPLAMLASTMTAAALGLGGLNRVRLVEQE